MAVSSQFSEAKAKTVFVPRVPQVCFQRCRLIHTDLRGNVKEIEVSPGETVVGSSSECEVFIDNCTVSRKHFAITYDDSGFMLSDLGSTNGTYVDEYRVKEVYLRPGAVIEAGEASFRFELLSEPVELEPSEQESFGTLVGSSTAMREVFSALERVAPSDATVLLCGETGTGKGAIARALHDASKRRSGPFVVFDCGATAPALVESELFGHEAGAFTGAVRARQGVLAESFGGTLLIDELADLPLSLQPKLLRALEEREFAPVGSNKPISLDTRIVASTQRDLWEEVLAGRFRRDLYFRVAVVTIPLPPLQKRREDIEPLVELFLGQFGGGAMRFADLSSELKEQILSYDWPGNIRELRNVVERLYVMEGSEEALWSHRNSEEGAIALPAGPDQLSMAMDYSLPFKEAKAAVVATFEKQYLERLLQRTQNNISQAARESEVNRRHLYTLLKRHGLGD